ncbi:uncharacterized protein LOC118373745 isoform X1 [Oncorhynchus keta]|uniref:uncharacterized protein LOC118373745 isoform X1 n=1 Tax=Oncorhynchus keta TaxID=8018 RepID=UPI00227C9FAD|nr:uncharacterized protein LOC118373745 isoform X1 [Oncorhynchus keta]XP_052375540.1 uncharacterized protein LOC118373745 isoform X1 [Oncorhynchus keta]XP_052375542.1 uncharacterized protein LOC118373745 isoform X1 [Oncorhynchus keta]
MGRLDDAAKRKVVELRQAGLSFRKIKAVLELENIRVSAQAIYLYLKEFQRKKVQRGGESAAATDPQITPGVGAGRGDGGSREGWNDQQIRNLLREASRHAGYVAASEFAKQCPGSNPPEVRGQGPSGTGSEGASRGQSNRTEKPEEGNKKEDEDIQIVSVTSLAQNSQQRGLPTAGAAAVTVTGAYMRKRATPSPATNPILAARKRLLDKALSHRAKKCSRNRLIRDSSYQSYQQVAALLRREQSNASGSDVQRPVAADQPQSYDPVTQRLTQVRNLDGQQGGSVPRQMFQQRVGGQAVRSPHPTPPRVGIRLPNPPPPPTSQGSSPVIRLQSPGSMNQGLLRRDRNPSPQQAAHQEAGGRCGGGGGGGGGLQEQVQTLGSEIHSLSLAVRMLVEQQYRLEREQVQQTQVQKQILSTLQTLASRLEAPCTSLHQQRQHPKTPPPPVLPASGSASYCQDTFPFSQGGYAQCSQAQPSYNGMDSSSLETIETFKLSGQSPHGINGFQTGSSSSTTDSLLLTHTPTYTLAHTQPYSSAYTQQPHTQTHMPSCTQSYATTYTQSHTQSYRGTDSPSTSTEGALQDCMAPTQASVDLDSDITVSPQETQLNIIKVEAL